VGQRKPVAHATYRLFRQLERRGAVALAQIALTGREKELPLRS
jgi:hypothetical protein